MRFQKPSFRLYTFVLGLVILSYVAIRSAIVSITIDEYTSLHQALQFSWYEIVSYEGFCLANNHLLTSLWLKAISTDATTALWLMRLPSVLSLGLYVFFSWRICLRLSPISLRWLALPALLAHTYVLDYFMLARGYGLAMAAILGAFYYLLAYWQSYRPVYAAWALLLGVLAALANFSFAYPLLAMSAIVGLLWVRRKPRGIMLPILLLGIGGLIYGYINPVGQRILACDPLYAGTDGNMVYGMFLPLFKLALYTDHEKPWAYLYADWQWALMVYGTVLCLLASIWLSAMRRSPLLLWAGLALLMVAGYVVQKELHGIRYPTDRTALYWLPVVVLLALGVWQATWQWLRPLAFVWLGLVLLPIGIGINLSYTRGWQYQAQADIAIQEIYRAAPRQGSIPIWCEAHSYVPMFYYEDRIYGTQRLRAHTNWVPEYQFLLQRQKRFPTDKICHIQFVYCSREKYNLLHKRYRLAPPLWQNSANGYVLARWPYPSICIYESSTFQLD